MAEPSDYSSSSEDDEYSDRLEGAASAGARLSTPEKVSISQKRKVPTNPWYDLGWERLSLKILMSQYDIIIIMYIISETHAKLDLFIKSLFKLLISLLH